MNTTEASKRRSLSRISGIGAILVSLCLLAAAAIAPTAGAVPKAPNGFLGVVPQVGVTHKDTIRMKRGKLKSLRIPVGWDLIQRDNGKQFDWNGIDATVRVAALEGVRVLPTLYATPPWLSGRTTNLPTRNKRQMDAWRKFVRAAVDRYGSSGDFWREPGQRNGKVPKTPIREWQIWNEANFHYFSTPVSPARYGRVLDAAARVIHKTDRRAEVVVSGLFARPKGSRKRAMDAVDFIRALSRHSKNNSVDSIAIHPYAKDTRTLKQIMRGFRRAAIKSGYRKKSIQVTEIGWASGPRKNAFLLGSKRRQANQLTSAFNYLVGDRRKLRLKNVYWYAWQDTDPKGDNCSFCYTIGLFEWRKGNKLVAKPAWRRFVKYTRGRP